MYIDKAEFIITLTLKEHLTFSRKRGRKSKNPDLSVSVDEICLNMNTYRKWSSREISHYLSNIYINKALGFIWSKSRRSNIYISVRLESIDMSMKAKKIEVLLWMNWSVETISSIVSTLESVYVSANVTWFAFCRILGSTRWWKGRKKEEKNRSVVFSFTSWSQTRNLFLPSLSHSLVFFHKLTFKWYLWLITTRLMIIVHTRKR